MFIIENERGGFLLEGRKRVRRILGDDRGEIGISHRALGTVDGIGGDEQLRMFSTLEIALIAGRDEQRDVGMSSTDFRERVFV